MTTDRKRDVVLAAIGRRNWRPDVMLVMAVAIIGWLVYAIWAAPDLNEYVKGVFTFVLGRFTGYLDSIYQFEFGSTRTSKTKDETISAMTRERSE